MTDSKRDPLSVEQIIEKATPLAQQLITVSMASGADLLSTVAAMEAAKRSLIAIGRESIGEEFYEQANRLIEGFDGFEEAAAAIGRGAFTQSGGQA